MTNARRPRLAANASIYTLANIANSAIPFVLLPLLTRVLTPHEYGLVTIFTTLITAIAGFVGLSAHGAINVHFFQDCVGHARFVGTAFTVLAVTTTFTLAIAVLTASWFAQWTDLSAIWLLLAVVAAAAQASIQIRLVIWQVRGAAIRYGLFQVLQTALNLSLSLVLVFAGLGWEGRNAGVAAALLLFAAIALVSLRRARLVEWCLDRSAALDVLRFGVPLVPHVLGTLLIATSDRLMVASLLSVHDAGVYAAGLQVGLVVGMLADAVVKALGPWVFAQLGSGDNVIKRRVVQLTYLYFGGIVLSALGLGVAAPYLLLLVGESFRSNGEVVMYIALGGAFGGMYLMVVNYIFYAKRNELLAAASLAVGLLNLAASYWLIGRNGAAGAAQAFAASQAVLFVVVWSIAARVHPMPWIDALRPATPRPLGT